MTRYGPILGLLLAACVTLSGCTGVSDVSSTLQVRISSTAYFVGATIPVVIENGTDERVHVAHCNHRVSLLLQRRVNGVWENHRQLNGPLCLTIYPMGELAIERGGRLEETLQIDEAGEFRLQLGARFAHEDFGSTVVYSRSFVVRYPPD